MSFCPTVATDSHARESTRSKSVSICFQNVARGSHACESTRSKSMSISSIWCFQISKCCNKQSCLWINKIQKCLYAFNCCNKQSCVQINGIKHVSMCSTVATSSHACNINDIKNVSMFKCCLPSSPRLSHSSVTVAPLSPMAPCLGGTPGWSQSQHSTPDGRFARSSSLFLVPLSATPLQLQLQVSDEPGMASHLETVSGGVSKLSSELFKGQRFTSQASNSLTAGTSSGARSKSFESLSSTSQAAIISQETSGSFERWVEQLKAPKSHRAKTTASTHLRHLSQSLCLILFRFFFLFVLSSCFGFLFYLPFVVPGSQKHVYPTSTSAGCRIQPSGGGIWITFSQISWHRN